MFFLFLSVVSSWDYSENGRDWEGLCRTGSSQSPININGQIAEEVSATSGKFWYLSLDYSDTLAVNTNTTQNFYGFNYNIGMNFNIFGSFGSSGISTLLNSAYTARNISLHSPSEHQINSTQYPLEIQITHTSGANSMILVVLYEESEYENKLLNNLIGAFEASIGKTINLRNAIDGWFAIKDFYYYVGSLTHPPCTENVKYVVYSKIMPATLSQINFFSRYISGNNRGLMPQNSRSLSHYEGLQDKLNWAFQALLLPFLTLLL